MDIVTGPVHGEAHPNAKMTEEGVRSMRKLHASGVGYDRLSKQFGVSKISVYKIVKRKAWAHVG